MIERLAQLKSWQLAILSGFLIGASFPPFKLGFFAWIGLIPFIRAVIRLTPWKAAGVGYLAGFITYVLTLHWLSFNIGASFPVVFAAMMAAAIYLAIFWAIFALLFSLIHLQSGAGLVLMPFLWVALEYGMSLGPMGFPWVSLATTQTDYLPVIQMVEWTGIYGISFWLVTVNVILYGLMTLPRVAWMPRVRTALVVIVMVWLAGYGRLATLPEMDEAKTVDLAVVQPNVGPHEKWQPDNRDWVFNRLDSLYMVATESEPDMIIWPEAATPAFLTKNYRRLSQIRQRIRQTGIPLLTGTVDWSSVKGRRVYHNSAALIREDGSIPVYHKRQLVPLGEFNPFARQLPISEELNLGHYTRGMEETTFQLNEASFASIICFESVFPAIVNGLNRRGAQFLVIVVNDGWFGTSAEPYQHEAIARLRAIENRYPVVRSANTGISAVIDRRGLEVKSMGIGETGVITASIVPMKEHTFYRNHGNWIVKWSLLATVVMAGVGWRRARA
ncbi:MAG TPA: apolipoprotein N-acyltransferase [Candidatus Marinimicrobia bacterium]|nr:apolipoprotein N-acyltransferase [Candidatus Neomarinimicrobiota bacterium]HIB72011.1 apolipoprotein N-acyltransferase [Candidatus Neomarinimicrobiota bacterium]HIB95704.1 apolipoprotein N-acyltransferase [Candidatus Neomarinimicrobiota bacterium]HIN62227.1 apolipoprotein N-acyltransferase [Candidatus Neomarinimicrobiota bacterium]HIO74366.1 apolipoprotein N-acyltransferase [Candidatus Neomarinimicrobiota bacterium]